MIYNIFQGLAMIPGSYVRYDAEYEHARVLLYYYQVRGGRGGSGLISEVFPYVYDISY